MWRFCFLGWKSLRFVCDKPDAWYPSNAHSSCKCSENILFFHRLRTLCKGLVRTQRRTAWKRRFQKASKIIRSQTIQKRWNNRAKIIRESVQGYAWCRSTGCNSHEDKTQPQWWFWLWIWNKGKSIRMALPYVGTWRQRDDEIFLLTMILDQLSFISEFSPATYCWYKFSYIYSSYFSNYFRAYSSSLSNLSSSSLIFSISCQYTSSFSRSCCFDRYSLKNRCLCLFRISLAN